MPRVPAVSRGNIKIRVILFTPHPPIFYACARYEESPAMYEESPCYVWSINLSRKLYSRINRKHTTYTCIQQTEYIILVSKHKFSSQNLHVFFSSSDCCYFYFDLRGYLKGGCKGTSPCPGNFVTSIICNSLKIN